jgi:hypothetical protein
MMGFAALYPSYGLPDGQINSIVLRPPYSREPCGSRYRPLNETNLPSGINCVGSFKFRAQKYSPFHLSEAMDF